MQNLESVAQKMAELLHYIGTKESGHTLLLLSIVYIYSRDYNQYKYSPNFISCFLEVWTTIKMILPAISISYV